MLLTDKEALEGLPESAVNAAAELAKSKDKKGWLISLSYPSYVPFMKFSSRRDLREKLYKAFSSKGFQDNSNNNEAIVLELVKLRQQRAQLLAYENHAQYVLEERMAKSPAKVKDFLNHLLEKALPAAKRSLRS